MVSLSNDALEAAAVAAEEWPEGNSSCHCRWFHSLSVAPSFSFEAQRVNTHKDLPWEDG